MRRIQLFEIHDQRWFPRFLRDQMTEGLQVVFDFANLYRPVAPRLRQVLADLGTNRVVDLCSGAGGPWLKLCETCASEFAGLDVLLTDKYPNAQARERIGASGSSIQFRREPVDVLALSPELAGFRTMFTSFHHFTPPEGREILRSAVASRQGIGIFEIPKRSARTILAVFVVPFAYLALVPSMRPFRWSRLLWTYLLPLIPFALWFDGIVSCLRAYTTRELMAMTEGLATRGYQWEAGEQRGAGIMPATVTYLIGWPTADGASPPSDPAAAECSARS